MDNSKEMIGSYEVTQKCLLGGKELLVGHDPDDLNHEYMTCYREVNFMGAYEYREAVASADYWEIMQIFHQRLGEQVRAVEVSRLARKLPVQPLGTKDCVPNGMDKNFVNKLIVLRPTSLAPEYQSADYQLGIATGGFGCYPESRGRAVYVENLYTGATSRWNRSDILGVADLENMPDWAKQKIVERKQNRTEQMKEEVAR